MFWPTLIIPATRPKPTHEVSAGGERRVRGQQGTRGGAPYHEGDLGGERRPQGGGGGESENEQAARGGHSDSLSGCGIAGRAETKMQRWTRRHNHGDSPLQRGSPAGGAAVPSLTVRRNGPVARGSTVLTSSW